MPVKDQVDRKDFLFSACNVTGTIVNFCCGIGKAPPLIDTSIVPGGATVFNMRFLMGTYL